MGPSHIYQFIPPRLDFVEDVECYTKGGFHPIVIGDVLDEKYTIIHKLGFGGFSTVWLARDPSQKLFSVKVGTASENKLGVIDPSDSSLHAVEVAQRIQSAPGSVKQFIDLPIANFRLKGPNGIHVCVVSQVCGPSLRKLSRSENPLSPAKARRAALQATQVMAWMHSETTDVCHGDLTNTNILLEIAGIESWTNREVYDRFGQPQTEDLYLNAEEERPLPNTAPEYIIEPANLTKLLPYATGNIRIIDFGEAWYPSNGLPTPRGTPFNFCPPEAAFDKEFSPASDVWALACCIAEMRGGRELFKSGFFGGNVDVASQQHMILGPLPSKYNFPGPSAGYTKMSPLKERILEIRNEIPADCKPQVAEVADSDADLESEGLSASSTSESSENSSVNYVRSIKPSREDNVIVVDVPEIKLDSAPSSSGETIDTQAQKSQKSCQKIVFDQPDIEQHPVSFSFDGTTDIRPSASEEVPKDNITEEAESEQDVGGPDHSLKEDNNQSTVYEYSDSEDEEEEEEPEVKKPKKPISKSEADCLLDLLEGALNYDASKRTTAAQMVLHSWFSADFDN